MKNATPRTDAVFYSFHTHDDLVNLAKGLEIELAEARHEVEKLNEEIGKLRESK